MRAFLVPLALLAAGACHAAETLEDAWRRAAEHDRLLASARATLQAAAAEERAARAARWPQLEASAGYTRFADAPALTFDTPAMQFRSPPVFADDTMIAGSATLRVALFSGGRIAAGIDAARRGVLGAGAEERVTESSLKLEVAEAYVAVLRGRRALEVAEASVRSLAAHVADVNVMVEREAAAKADLLAARVALADAEQFRVRAQNSLSLAVAVYNRHLGEPLDRMAELDAAIPADEALAGRSVTELTAQALQRRAEIESLAARAAALQAQAMAERGSSLPQVSLEGGVSYLRNEILDRERFSTVGIAVSWNVFGGGTRNRAASLRAASRAAQHRVADLRSLIELEVRSSWLAIGDARARVAATREAVAEADENLRMARELYASGIGTNTQVLDAVALQVRAGTNSDDAALDASVALLRLARAVGEL